jgi:hypothetical protein
VHNVAYAEGCFGYHLLREDPASSAVWLRRTPAITAKRHWPGSHNQ